MVLMLWCLDSLSDRSEIHRHFDQMRPQKVAFDIEVFDELVEFW